MLEITVPEMMIKGAKAFEPTGIEGNVLEMVGGGLRLISFLRRPVANEISEFGNSEKWFGLHVFRSVIFLAFRFGSMPWNVAPFSMCCYPEGEVSERFRPKDSPPDGVTNRWLLNYSLVDSLTGKVATLGAITLPANVTKAFHAAVLDQLEGRKSFSGSQHEADIALAYKKYPGNDDLAHATSVQGQGGK